MCGSKVFGSSMESNKARKVECEACSATVNFRQLERHKQGGWCKKVVCGVCALELPYLHLKDHEADCAYGELHSLTGNKCYICVTFALQYSYV